MRTTRFLVGLTALLVLTLASAKDVWACSCPMSGPQCQSVFQTDAIFAGTLRNISPLPEDDLPPPPPGSMRIPRTLSVDFADVQMFRGGPTAVISVLTPGSGPACGYQFKQGERYLVYASRQRDGKQLVTGICSRTRLLADAAEDLRFLQTLSNPSREGARVYGTINHGERDLASGEGRDYGPVAGVFVSVLGQAGNFSASTDEHGRFEAIVPPGKYEVTAHPPAQFSARYMQRTVELSDARTCGVVDFSVRFDGRISGTVRQSSAADSSATAVVQLMAVQDVGKSGYIRTVNVESDASGHFEFSEVSPGRYLVGVDLTRRMDPKLVFPTTFYPGTADPAMATVVEITGGQHRELDPMPLPAARRSFRLTGTVVYQDGSPVTRATISLRDQIERGQQVTVGTQTQSDGAFSFVVHEGLRYTAFSVYWDDAQRKQIVGSYGPFVASPEMGPVKVVL